MSRKDLVDQCIQDEGYFREVIKDMKMDAPLEKTFMHYALHASREARQAKRKHAVFSFLAMFLPILSAALGLKGMDFSKLNLTDPNDLLRIVNIGLSLMTSVATGCLSLFHYKDTWNRYRWYIENLISILLEAIGMKNEKTETGEDLTEEQINLQVIHKLQELNNSHLKKWEERKVGNNGN